LTDTSNDEKYYTVSEVAKIRGIRRQSVIDGCKRGQYHGAYKTEPDSFNRQGVWKIPVTLFDTPTATQEVMVLNKPITPADLKNMIEQVVDERMSRLEKRLESHDKLLMETLRETHEKNSHKRRGWWKFW